MGPIRGSGPSFVRAELYDESGRSVAGTETKLDYDLEYAPDGGVVKGAEELLDLIARAIDGALSNARNVQISGVAMSTFWHSVVGFDREDRPTTPIITWADRRAAGAARELRESIDEAAIHHQHGLRAPLELLARQALVAEPRESRGLREDRALGIPRRLLLRSILRGLARGMLADLGDRAL